AGLSEIQASVSLPVYGSRGRIIAPGLPRKEIEQLTNCISQIDDMQIGDLDYTIHCRLPGERRYRGVVGLPLCLAMIGPHNEKALPARQIYLGEVDLLCNVRPAPVQVVQEFTDALQAGEVPTPLQVVCAPQSARLLAGASGVTIVACDHLR